jgi:glycosyltransferase involved in cell wall biosynthesis
MAYHIVLNRPTDLAAITEDARSGLAPRHSMAELQARLGATVHDGAGARPAIIDRMLGAASRMSPLWWAMARKLRRELKAGDVVFCTGEDVGFPVACLCGGRRDIRVTMMAHRVDSFKKRLAMRIFSIRRKAALIFTVARPQADFLTVTLGFSRDRVRFIWDQTDTRFFRPGPTSADKRRPVVMSIGLEQRDYSTLAKATSSLDLDVRISGFSADTRSLARAFPEILPENMTRRFYAWPDLLQLYRDADVVVVSLFDNAYAAGVQGFMEGLACGRPLVVTATSGLSAYLTQSDAVTLVKTGDSEAMRQAICDAIVRNGERGDRAEAIRALATQKHACEHYVDHIADALRELSALSSEAPARGGVALGMGF